MTTEGWRLYFAYGSNMDREQMRVRCPTALFVGTARLANHRFRINKRGVATKVPEAGQEVYGVVWRITASDEEALDGYEGVKFGTYRKELVDVSLSSGTTERVLTYVASESSVGRPKPGYMERILRGAKEASLPPDYIQQLRKWVTSNT